MDGDQIFEEESNEVKETGAIETGGILTSIKKLIGGIREEDEQFDADIIIHINSVLGILTQIGVGPAEGFSVYDKSAVWSDFLQDSKQFEMVKSFVHLKVRLLFDPPLNSAVIESMNRMANELEWRISKAVEEESGND